MPDPTRTQHHVSLTLSNSSSSTSGLAFYMTPLSPAQVLSSSLLTNSSHTGRYHIQAREIMYHICHNHRKGQKANGAPLIVALEHRTVFQEAKDSVVAVWEAVELQNSITVFKRRLQQCLTPGGMRLITSLIATAAAAADTRNGGGDGDDDAAAARDETRGMETARWLFAPQIHEAIEKFLSRVISAPYGTRLEDMYAETLERESQNGANDDAENGVAGPSAILSIEEEGSDAAGDGDASGDGDGDSDSVDSVDSIIPFPLKPTPPPIFPGEYCRVDSAEYDPSFRVVLCDKWQLRHDKAKEDFDASYPTRFRGLRTEEKEIEAQREAASFGSRADKQPGSLDSSSLLPTPPQSQPVRGASPAFAGPDGHPQLEMEEEEEQQQQDVEVEEDSLEVSQPLLLHAGHALGFASTPAPPETDDNIMHTDFDEFIWDFEPDLPPGGPSSSGPPRPPTSHRGRPSPSLGPRATSGHTPGRDLPHPTPARSESGLFVPQKETPVPLPDLSWLYPGKAKREETIPPLSVVASQGTSNRVASTRPPSQQPATDRQTRSAAAISEPPHASRFSSRAVAGASAASDEASAPEQAAQAAATTVPADALSGTPSPSRSRRAHRGEPVYNIAELSGTAAHGKRRQKGSTASNRKRKAVSGTAEETQQSGSSATSTTQPRQSDDHATTNATGSGPATKRPKKTEEKKGKGKGKGKGNGKKPKGKEKEKGKEKVTGKKVEQGTSGGTRPGPAVVDARSEEALRLQLAKEGVNGPQHARHNTRPGFAPLTFKDVQRQAVTTIRPPQRPPATVTAAATPVPVAETYSHGQKEPAMPSSSHSRASQGAPRAPGDKPKPKRPTPPPPPEEQRQKQQHMRHQSIYPTFSGTHTRLDAPEATESISEENRDTVVEIASSPVAGEIGLNDLPNPPLQQLPLRETVEGDGSPHHHQDSPVTPRRKNKSRWSRQRKRQRSRMSARDSTTVPPSPSVPLPRREPTHEPGIRQSRQHSMLCRRGSVMPPPPPPAMDKVTPERRHGTASSSRRGSVVPPPAPAGPPRGRYSTPWEWRGEDSMSPEQRKRSCGAADTDLVPAHNKKRRVDSTDRHGTPDKVDLTSVPLPEPSSSSSSAYPFTYAMAPTAAATSSEQQQQQVVECHSSAPPRQQAENNSHAKPAEEAYACNRRFMSVPPALNARGRYRVAEVAHKAPNTVNALYMLRVEKRLMDIENQLGQKE